MSLTIYTRTGSCLPGEAWVQEEKGRGSYLSREAWVEEAVR
jgi:hypothetical protein